MSSHGRYVAPDEGRDALRVWLDRQALWRLAAFARGYRLQAAATILVMVAFTATGLAGPYLLARAIDGGIRQGNLNYLLLIGVLYLTAGIVGAVLNGLQTYGVNWVGERIIRDLRDTLFRHLTSLDVGYHTRQRAGWVISRLTNDIEALEQLLTEGMTQLVTNVLTLVGAVIILFALDAKLAAVTLTVLPFLLVSTAVFRTQAVKAYRRVRETVADVTAALQESVSGVRVVQAFVREDRNQELFEEVNDEYRRANVRTVYLSGTYFPSVEFLAGLATAIILLYGGRQVIDGTLTIGVMAAFIGYLSSFFDPVQSLSELYNTFQSAGAALDKIFSVLETEPDETEWAGARPPGQLRGDIRYENVSFSYDPTGVEILHGVDLTIPAGQRVALVGPTGAGKTTIARLLLRFYRPNSGHIYVDGVELQDYDIAAYRRQVGYVPQEPYLFSGTVLDNVRFTRPDATLEEVRRAAQELGVDDLLCGLPDGYETEVQERGSRLSAGERQIVAFARAFFTEPSILILDEATSSVDPGTERRVELTLGRLLQGRTSLIIAHRLSTVERSDRILVVEDGCIVEDGTHDELLAAGGPYARLYRSQLSALEVLELEERALPRPDSSGPAGGDGDMPSTA